MQNRDPSAFFAHIKSLNFEPATVLDVGVAWGTPPLYEAFPKAYYHLFEALPEFEPALKSILKQVLGEYHLCALAAENGTPTISVGPEPLNKAGASIFHTQPAAGQTQVRLTVRRLDDVLRGRELARPVLLKVDAQGADIEVVKGGQTVVQQCEVVILEVGMFPFANSENQSFLVIEQMRRLGFVPYDFFSFLERGYDKALGQVDIAFVKEQGRFRKYPAWA